MIVGAAVVPTAPLLVSGVSQRLPDGLTQVADAAHTTLRALPAHDVVVLVAAAPEQAVHAAADATLAGIARPEMRLTAPVDPAAARVLADATKLPLAHECPLPLGSAVLAQLYVTARVAAAAPVVPLTVRPDADPPALESIGAGIDGASGDRRAVVIVAGDLSAGLTERSPLAQVAGARAWDEEVVDLVASGRIGRLARLGPDEAKRVGSVGWAPLVVLHGVCERARLATVVRCYAAPRGVGYLVASAG